MANLELSGVESFTGLAGFGLSRTGSPKGLEYVKGVSKKLEEALSAVGSLRKEVSHLRKEREADHLAILRLQEMIEDLDDALDAQVQIQDARENGTVPWEDVKRELGL